LRNEDLKLALPGDLLLFNKLALLNSHLSLSFVYFCKIKTIAGNGQSQINLFFMTKTALICLFFLFINSKANTQTFERIEGTAGFGELQNTAGVAVADYDQDGDLDVFIVAKNDYSAIEPTSWSRLFSNNNNGTFTDKTLAAGFGRLHDKNLTDPGWEQGVKIGASWGDYDNDGFPDLFLTNYQSFQLFRNQTDGSFEEVTASAGLPTADSCYYYTALWWDFNKDGHLDLFVPSWLGCTQNKFYQNNGNGTFTERTDELGLGGTEEGSLMSVPIDANADGRWDLYIANDFSENELFIQQPDFTFINQAAEYQVDHVGNDMGMTIGDYDNNGAFDIYVSNISENRLLTPTGNNTYLNLAEAKNVLNTYWGWDTRFADFDLDGDEDLFVLNGYESDRLHYSALKENFYFKNKLETGDATFQDWSVESQVHEFSNSISMGVFDYDHDGDPDVLISNMDASPFFYENKVTNGSPSTEPHWINLQLEGTVSNRDGLGSYLAIWSGGKTQNRLFYGAGFMSQSLQPVHFGLGEAMVIDSLEIRWNSGIQERFYDLPVNRHFHFIENQGYTIVPLAHEKVYGCTDANACNFDETATVNNGSCSYRPTPDITGNNISGYLKTETYQTPEQPNTTYRWSITHGKILGGQGTASISVKWELEKEGILQLRTTNNCDSELATLSVTLSFAQMETKHSIARLWNEALLYAIRNDFARPTVHARNLFHMSAAMYDAWAVYDEEAQTYLLGKNVHGFIDDFTSFTTTQQTSDARQESISYAAYRLLRYRFLESPGSFETRQLIDCLFEELGYDKNHTTTDYRTGDPAALGNYIAKTIIDFGHQDGAAERQKYVNSFYETTNPPLVIKNTGNPDILDPNRWQPLALETFIDQAGNFIEGTIPEFLSPEWGNVTPFSLPEKARSVYQRSGDNYAVYHDPGTPPQLDTTRQSEGTQQYKWGFSLVSLWGSHLSPTDNVIWDISPKSIGNISLQDFPDNFSDYPNFYQRQKGGDIGKGHRINPVSQQPYKEQLVYRGDFTRVLAEFWADGPDSETPPGHWFVLLNTVNDQPLLKKQLGGKGATLSDLEWDIKSYFIMGGTMHDAAISAWSIKGWHDYIRPVSAIRYMAQRGQSSDPDLPNYDIAGIPLEPGYVALVDSDDPLAGNLGENIGKIKVYSWRGPDYILNPESDEAGVGWILAERWMPYQRPSFVTPPFAGYVSGHSTYSRAAAEVMTLLTGDAYFPGGMGEFIAHKNDFLIFEEGPSEDVVLQWATYRDASDQCSLSRIWGGIHPPADDIPGRIIGEKIGREAFSFAIPYFSSAKNMEDKSPIVLFPNPAKNTDLILLNNTTKDMVVRMVNIQGRDIPIVEQKFDANFNCTSIKIGNVAAGTYILYSEQKSWKLVIL